MSVMQMRHTATSLPEAVESSHFHHPDFRGRNKIFATPGYPDERCGMVRLTPDQQTAILRAAPVLRPRVVISMTPPRPSAA